MNLKLTNTHFQKNGIFGKLEKEDGTLVCYTLQHAYQNGDKWEPKVPAGTYQCLRGTHQLEHGGPFETFEVLKVPGHTGILFHAGNTQDDSHGCILLGMHVCLSSITDSRAAFGNFMALQNGVNSFFLEVVNEAVS